VLARAIGEGRQRRTRSCDGGHPTATHQEDETHAIPGGMGESSFSLFNRTDERIHQLSLQSHVIHAQKLLAHACSTDHQAPTKLAVGRLYSSPRGPTLLGIDGSIHTHTM
jgi:hypothetical protein